MELKGKVKKIGELQSFASGFQKKELVIITDEQYPQPISIEFLKDKIDLLDNLKVGDEVNVSINIGGREWTSPQNDVRYFNSITGWRVENLTKEQPTSATQTATPEQAFDTPTGNNVFAEEEDDLPF